MSSRSEQCEISGCDGRVEAKGVCRTHRRHLEEYGSVEVQAIIEAREARELRKKELDWEYLSDDQVAAIERGVRDAYFDSDGLNSFDLENMLQEMWVWAAGHKAEVQKIRSLKLLRRQAKSWSVRGNMTEWNRDRKLDYLEDYGLTDEEED